MAFELPALPYAHDALEPHIDARTMEIHHGKHHNGYTNKLNAAIAGTDLEGKKIEAIEESLQFKCYLSFGNLKYEILKELKVRMKNLQVLIILQLVKHL